MKRGWGLIAAAGLLCGITIGRAESPATSLEDAAKSIGKTVTFVAEVKGVSCSPRSRATYLNFGNTYPRQTLSARIGTEKQRIADDLPTLPGRTVRVTGPVEATPTGPIVPITKASQIEVFPLEAGDVLHEEGEGDIYSQRIGLALRGMLARDDYDGLEKIAREWRDTKARTRDGSSKLAMFFEAFSPSSRASDAFFKERFAALDAWHEARPDSPLPAIAAAQATVSYAWAARGNSYASDVPEWAWKRFYERLEDARRKLEASQKHGRDWPAWYSAMQGVALGQQWERADYEKLFREAVTCDPGYEDFYLNKAYWLQPRWYGQPGEWEAFAADAAKTQGNEMYARICWNLSRLRPNIFTSSNVNWPLALEGFQDMIEKYPKSKRDLSYFGLLAGMAGDKATCAEIIEKMGDDPDFSAWISWENIDLAKAWTKNPQAPAPVIFRRSDSR